jgi:hypothetical protein
MKHFMTSRTVSTVVSLSISLLFVFLFGFAGIGKIGPVPEWFVSKFGGTILATFPGIFVSFYSIALFELAIFALVLLSLAKREFLAGNFKPYLFLALSLSLLVFVQLLFGKLLVSELDDVAKLFVYFVGTLICLLSIRFFEKESF